MFCREKIILIAIALCSRTAAAKSIIIVVIKSGKILRDRIKYTHLALFTTDHHFAVTTYLKRFKTFVLTNSADTFRQDGLHDYPNSNFNSFTL